jgi:hypothetical protein
VKTDRGAEGSQMFGSLKSSAKLIGAITLVLLITSGISFWILQGQVNQQAVGAASVPNPLKSMTAHAGR